MRREIEFRAWDKRNKKYYQPVFLGDDGEVHAYVSKRHDIDCIGDIKEFDIEQYTGLKDKNGNKIFEGDILKAGDKFIYEVVFDQHTCSFMLENKYGRNNLTEPKGRHYEIIGNIHEEVK